VASFIANIGGMLGFSNGFSIVCAIELFYIVFIRKQQHFYFSFAHLLTLYVLSRRLKDFYAVFAIFKVFQLFFSYISCKLFEGMIHIRVLFNLSAAKNNVADYLIVCAAYYTSGYKTICSPTKA
jgi:hypothetical protein